MNVSMKLLLLMALPCLLEAQNWEVFVATGVQSPSTGLSDETLNTYGQRQGRSLSLSSDFRQASLGASYNLLSYGAFRLRVGVETTVGGPNPDLMVRYLVPSGLTEYYTQASGTLRLQTTSPGLTVVWVAPWAGEYGLGVESRMQKLTFSAGSVAKDTPTQVGTNLPAILMSKASNETFMTAHAAFVQQYPEFALFARFLLAFNLKPSTTVGSFAQDQFGSVDPGLLEALMPRSEIKVSAGVRF